MRRQDKHIGKKVIYGATRKREIGRIHSGRMGSLDGYKQKELVDEVIDRRHGEG